MFELRILTEELFYHKSETRANDLPKNRVSTTLILTEIA